MPPHTRRLRQLQLQLQRDGGSASTRAHDDGTGRQLPHRLPPAPTAAAEAGVQLSPEQVQSYVDDGYVVVISLAAPPSVATSIAPARADATLAAAGCCRFVG